LVRYNNAQQTPLQSPSLIYNVPSATTAYIIIAYLIYLLNYDPVARLFLCKSSAHYRHLTSIHHSSQWNESQDRVGKSNHPIYHSCQTDITLFCLSKAVAYITVYLHHFLLFGQLLLSHLYVSPLHEILHETKSEILSTISPYVMYHIQILYDLSSLARNYVPCCYCSFPPCCCFHLCFYTLLFENQYLLAPRNNLFRLIRFCRCFFLPCIVTLPFLYIRPFSSVIYSFPLLLLSMLSFKKKIFILLILLFLNMSFLYSTLSLSPFFLFTIITAAHDCFSFR